MKCRTAPVFYRGLLGSAPVNADHSTQLQVWIDRVCQGDLAAREELIAATCERLRKLAHGMLARDRVRRWEQTDDVLQQALVRVHRELANVQPKTVREYLHFAGFHIRRVLIELARHYYRPHGLGANHHSTGHGDTDRSAEPFDTSDGGLSPSQEACRAERWIELHEQIEQLPADEQEVVELLWCHELTQPQAADLLGIDVRTVRRRWQRARLRLFDALAGELPVF
jgi:RNA polymerase sigma factor (sigma-70 family)